MTANKRGRYGDNSGNKGEYDGGTHDCRVETEGISKIQSYWRKEPGGKLHDSAGFYIFSRGSRKCELPHTKSAWYT